MGLHVGCKPRLKLAGFPPCPRQPYSGFFEFFGFSFGLAFDLALGCALKIGFLVPLGLAAVAVVARLGGVFRFALGFLGVSALIFSGGSNPAASSSATKASSM